MRGRPETNVCRPLTTNVIRRPTRANAIGSSSGRNEARTKQLELDAVIRQGENEYRRQLASLARAVASSPRAPQAFLIATLLFAFATAIVMVDVLFQ